MILLHTNAGEIVRAIYNRDWFSSSHDENTQQFEIDEIDENFALCKDIFEAHTTRDVNGLPKYYIQDGQLFMREGWVEWLPL